MAVRAKGTVRNGSKRSPTLSPSLSTTKKPKAKKKATGAFKVLLNLLHITDKKRSRSEVPDLVPTSHSDQDQDTKLAASSTWSPETVANDHISQDSSPKDRHCKSWSYYVHDPFDVFTGADDDGDDPGNAEVFYNDSYFEDDYCQDYRDHNEQDIGSVKTPHLRGIQMGVDSLGTSVIEQTKTICGEFKRDCARRQVTRKRHKSLPDFKTARTFEVMPFDEEEDLQEVEHDREAAQYHMLPPYTPPPLSLNIVFGELSLDDTAHSIAAYDFQEGTNKWEPHENQTRFIPNNPYSSASKEVSSGLVDYTSSDSDLLGNPQASQAGERRATYKDKRPSPLNIRPVFDVNLPETGAESVPSFSSMYSECLTSDNNMDISPQEKSNLCDSQEQTNSSDDSKSSFITAQSSSVLLKYDTNSFPSSSDDDDTNAVFVPRSKVSPSGQGSVVGNKNLTRRRYTESGYDTCGKVSSTPNTPPDPEKKLSDSLNMIPHTQHNVKPGVMLSALGNVTSAAALNKLDGLSTPPCSPRSPRFKFPPKRRPCSKNTSMTESEQTPAKVSRCLNDGAKESVAASPATNMDEMQCGAGARPKSNVQWAERFSSPSCTGLNPLRPINHADTPSVNYTDENGNCVTPNHVTSASHQRSICFEFAATPLNKIPTPVSTSSPLQKLEMQNKSGSKSLGLLVIDVSPVKQSVTTPTSKHNSHLSKGDSGVRKRRRRKADLSMDSSRTRAGRDLNNNLLKSRIAGSDEEIEVISPSSRDYLLLKRAADCIVNRISAKRELKQYMDMGRLVEYLNTFYHAEIAKLARENIRTVSDFRNVKLESCDIFTSERLTVENCIKELLFSALVNRPQIVSKCADFAFENLHYISTTSDFLQASPELVLMILSNNHSVVNGPHGFPLAYKESEGQVHRAVMKYIETHKSDRPVDQKLAEMLYSVTDPNVRAKNSHGIDPAGKSCLHLNLEGYHNACRRVRRPYHEIKFRKSDTFVTTPDTRQEYLFQPYLSSALSSYPATDLQRSPDSTSSPADDIMNFCNSAHTLRKLYFSYRRHNKVPYITKIDLQYAYHGRKKMYSIGGSDVKLLSDFTVLSSVTDSYNQRKDMNTRAENKQDLVHLLPTTQTSSRADENRSSLLVSKSMVYDEACSLTDDDTTVSTSSSREVQTTTAVKLEAGEHVTGVAVQGDAVLHNVEITTNKGRQVRAHGLSDITREALWTPIPPPEETSYCLQALYAHAKSPSSRTYLRNIGAVWAVMSRPMNNLSV